MLNINPPNPKTLIPSSTRPTALTSDYYPFLLSWRTGQFPMSYQLPNNDYIIHCLSKPLSANSIPTPSPSSSAPLPRRWTGRTIRAIPSPLRGRRNTPPTFRSRTCVSSPAPGWSLRSIFSSPSWGRLGSIPGYMLWRRY